jgi:DNA-binding response OmpR family regulator
MEREETPPEPRAGAVRLLLVDDEPDLLSTLAEILQHHGFAVVSSLEGEEAVEIASVFDPNVLVTDYSLPGMDGVTTIQKIREQRPRVRALLVSGYISRDTRRRAMQEQVDAIMEKPVSVAELLTALGEGRPGK